MDFIFTFLQDNESGFNLIFICVFGIPLFCLVFSIYVWLTNKIGFKSINQFLIKTFYLAFLVLWFGGFIISMILYNIGIESIKVLFILIGLFIITTIFHTLNKQKVDDLFDYLKNVNPNKLK